MVDICTNFYTKNKNEFSKIGIESNNNTLKLIFKKKKMKSLVLFKKNYKQC